MVPLALISSGPRYQETPSSFHVVRLITILIAVFLNPFSFNELWLPPYRNRETLEKMLRLAMHDGADHFGLR